MRNRTSHTGDVRARELRRVLTPAETILWQRLRNKQLSGWKFRRQEPIGFYIADFFCFPAKLVVELDGASHEAREKRDYEKDDFMTRSGFRILRFRNEQIYENLTGVLETILHACENYNAPTQPPREGEEEVVVRTVILIGFMGCGKSSVARALAARLHGEAVDLDQRIEARVGTTIAQLFVERGEEEFRRIETKALEEILDGARGDASTPTLVATGGGIVTREENRKLLKDAGESGVLVVYLKATPEVLAERIRRQPGLRPLIDGERVLGLQETRARVEALLAQRAPWYEEVANCVVDSGALPVDVVAAQIAEQFAKANR